MINYLRGALTFTTRFARTFTTQFALTFTTPEPLRKGSNLSLTATCRFCYFVAMSRPLRIEYHKIHQRCSQGKT